MQHTLFQCFGLVPTGSCDPSPDLSTVAHKGRVCGRLNQDLLVEPQGEVELPSRWGKNEKELKLIQTVLASKNLQVGVGTNHHHQGRYRSTRQRPKSIEDLELVRGNTISKPNGQSYQPTTAIILWHFQNAKIRKATNVCSRSFCKICFTWANFAATQLLN